MFFPGFWGVLLLQRSLQSLGLSVFIAVYVAIFVVGSSEILLPLSGLLYRRIGARSNNRNENSKLNRYCSSQIRLKHTTRHKQT